MIQPASSPLEMMKGVILSAETIWFSVVSHSVASPRLVMTSVKVGRAPLRSP